MGRINSPHIADLPFEDGGSPVTKKIARSKIQEPVRLMLFAQSGGFCQFDGCEMSVIEHHVTKAKENHSNQAHIVAYKEGGPRGDPTVDGTYINSIENLMLLCPGC